MAWATTPSAPASTPVKSWVATPPAPIVAPPKGWIIPNYALFSSVGTLSATIQAIANAIASFSGSGQLAAVVSQVKPAPVQFAGSGQLSAYVVPSIGAAFGGSGQLSAGIIKNAIAVAALFLSEGTLSATVVAVTILKTATLVDNFATLDTTKWTFDSGITVPGGQLSIVPPSGSAGAHSVATFDLTSSYVFAELIAPPNVGTGTVFTMLSVADASGDYEAWVWNNNQLSAREHLSGSDNDFWITYSSANHKWLRIRESGGIIYWDTSPDTITWTNQRSKAVGVPSIVAAFASAGTLAATVTPSLPAAFSGGGQLSATVSIVPPTTQSYTVYIPFRNGICSTGGCYPGGTTSATWGTVASFGSQTGNSSGPYGCVDASGNVYTTNNGFTAGKIIQMSQTGTLTNMTPSGIGATIKGIDTDGTYLYVVDQTNSQVQKIAISGLAMTSFGFTGLSSPVDVTVDSAGSCYCLSATAITKRTSGGTQSTIAAPATGMCGITIDKNDVLYVATTSAVYKQSGSQGSGTWTNLGFPSAVFQGTPAVDANGVVYILTNAYILYAYCPTSNTFLNFTVPAGGGNNSRIAGICAGVPAVT